MKALSILTVMLFATIHMTTPTQAETNPDNKYPIQFSADQQRALRILLAPENSAYLQSFMTGLRYFDDIKAKQHSEGGEIVLTGRSIDDFDKNQCLERTLKLSSSWGNHFVSYNAGRSGPRVECY